MSGEIVGIAVVLGILAGLLVGVPLWRHRQGGLAVAGVIAVVALLPLAVLALYTRVTSYPWDQQELVTAPPQGSPAQVLEMVSQLAERMETEPTVEGLSMLGQSYRTLERFEESVEAWHRAWEMTEGEDPIVSISYAEALIIVDRDTLLTSAGELLEKALLQAPFEPRALFYSALSRIAKGDYDIAEARLVQLLNNPELPEQLRLVVQDQLTALNARQAAEGGASAANSSEEAAGPAIAVTVSIDSALSVPPRAILYVFAREADSAGAPPIAVKRVPATDFPAEIVLTDRDAMVAGRKLADAAALEVTARISATGNAIASAGDIYGTVRPAWSGESVSFDLVIDSVVAE
ncbi:MAG: hypothetical protein HKN56_00795 [Gammaproteobacteria bacterium]|nr:hypothetical protein [Gammaproteobacteria bacterium]